MPLIRGVYPPLRGAALLGVLIFCCALWTYWTIEVRLAPLRIYTSNVTHEVRLQQEIEVLKKNTDAEIVTTVQRDIAQAKRCIFPGYQALANWLHEQSAAAHANGLDLRYVLGDERLGDGGGVIRRVSLDLTLKINVHGAASDSYQRLMRHLLVIHESEWTKEISRAALESVGGKVEILELSMQLWMHDDETFQATLQSLEMLAADLAPQL